MPEKLSAVLRLQLIVFNALDFAVGAVAERLFRVLAWLHWFMHYLEIVDRSNDSDVQFHYAVR